MTYVPPTTAQKKLNHKSAMNKPPNLVIYGTIREHKGFEFALDLIEQMHEQNLPSRPLVVGSPSSSLLLSLILNKKFGYQFFKEVTLKEMMVKITDESSIQEQVND